MFPVPGLRLPGDGLFDTDHVHRRRNHDRHRSVIARQPHGLFDILPELYGEHEHLRRDPDVLIDRFVADCPEVFPRCRFNPLREEEVRRVYYATIRELSRSSSDSLGCDVARTWLRRLERLMEVDRGEARMTNEVFVHRRSNHLFRALAEVSYANRSLRIGQVLHSFFIRYASQIVSTETSATIEQWCNAVLRAHMTDTQRRECFRHVHRLRPDLPQSLRRYGRRGQLVAETMERLSIGFVAESRNIGFERPELGHRSRSAGLLAGDRGLLGLGRDVRNDRHGLASDGLLAGDLHGMRDMERADFYGLRSDRSLLQDSAHRQRMLDLSMDHGYTLRLDDMGAFDNMGLLTLEDGVDEVFMDICDDVGLNFDSEAY